MEKAGESVSDTSAAASDDDREERRQTAKRRDDLISVEEIEEILEENATGFGRKVVFFWIDALVLTVCTGGFYWPLSILVYCSGSPNILSYFTGQYYVNASTGTPLGICNMINFWLVSVVPLVLVVMYLMAQFVFSMSSFDGVSALYALALCFLGPLHFLVWAPCGCCARYPGQSLGEHLFGTVLVDGKGTMASMRVLKIVKG